MKHTLFKIEHQFKTKAMHVKTKEEATNLVEQTRVAFKKEIAEANKVHKMVSRCA